MAYIYDRGVSINGKHSFEDWGLMLVSTSIDAPKPKTNYISIPFRNGDIDATEAVDADIKYENRDITINLRKIGDFDENKVLADEIINEIHGINAHLIFDDDLAFYYNGRLEVSYKRSMDILNLTIKANVEPYKYSVQSSSEDWLWDELDFLNGVINEAKSVQIDNSGSITILATSGVGYPTITTDKNIKVTFNGIAHTLNADTTTVLYDFEISKGENTFTINTVLDEVATVTIDYRGGML